jgi:hypothetical protein
LGLIGVKWSAFEFRFGIRSRPLQFLFPVRSKSVGMVM